ncbi:MAG: hypothetical protein JST42_07965 [Bacteroidetes bacterium]|nr:hypothetical protein [Bacteroidota bacterium]
MNSQNAPIFLRFGGAAKDTTQMSREELEGVAVSIRRRAKEKAFFMGQPIIFGRDGKIFEEWPDGRIVEHKQA